jgi:D-sedoheptulose 7-phosphate isomerase
MRFIDDLIAALNSVPKDSLNGFKNTIRVWKGSIILLGNGGSNAIASHMAEDYTKALGKRATCFSDAARMSCYANDYGYDKAFSQYIKEFADKNSLVILISSSGNSKNILNCAEYCKSEGIAYVTLTGFDEYNQINDKYSDFALHGFWIDSTDYGVVECAHEAILHSVI